MSARSARSDPHATRPYTGESGSEWPWWDGGRLFELYMARMACNDGFPVRVERDLMSRRVKISCALPADATAHVEASADLGCSWSVAIEAKGTKDGLERAFLQVRDPASSEHSHASMLTRQDSRLLTESLNAKLKLVDDEVLALAMDQLVAINRLGSPLAPWEKLAAQSLLFQDLEISTVKIKIAQLRKKAVKQGFWEPELKQRLAEPSAEPRPAPMEAEGDVSASVARRKSAPKQPQPKAPRTKRKTTNAKVIELSSDSDDQKPSPKQLKLAGSAAAPKAGPAPPQSTDETLERLLQELSPSFDFSAYLDLFRRQSVGILTASQLREIAKSGLAEVDYIVDELKQSVTKSDGTVEAGLPGVWALRLRSCLLALAPSQ